MSEGPPSPKRLRLDMDDVGNLSREELIEKLREMNDHVSYLHSKQRGSIDKDDGDDKDGDDKLKQQSQDSSRRENTLVLRLTNKEQELQDCMNQIAEMKASQAQNSAQLRSLLLDPAVNLVFQRMAKEMDDCKEKLKQTQNELSAWKFTADSQMGKRLMAKCRMLLQENEDLGKMISSGRTSKLEAEIAIQKTMVTEMKTNQDEMNEFVSELEEDVEGMQSMIYVLQQQLKETKEHLATVEAENARLLALQAAASKTVKEEPSETVNSVIATHSRDGEADNGLCVGGGGGCAPETSCNSNNLDGGGGGGGGAGEGSCGVEVGGDETAKVGVVLSGNDVAGAAASKARTSAESPSPQTTGSSTATAQGETTQLSPTPGLGKKAALSGGDDVDGTQHQQQTNGRTTTEDVVPNPPHHCSLAPAENTDLRSDQACDQVPSVQPAKTQLDNQTENSPPVTTDRNCKGDALELKIVTPDGNPVQNGDVDMDVPLVENCEK